MRVISIFDRSGVMVQPWHLAGHSVLTIDIDPARHDMPSIQADITKLDPKMFNADIVFAFPPCTEFAGSGARWWATKPSHLLENAIVLLDAARAWVSIAEKYWMLENPIGRLASIWRPADWAFNPHEYAGWSDSPDDEAYTKCTCIWANFLAPVRKSVVPVLGSKMHMLPPGPERQYLRSITPQGFSRAIHHHLSQPLPEQQQLWKIKNI